MTDGGVAAEKYLRIVLQYVTDLNAQGTAVTGAGQITTALKQVETQAMSTYTQMRMLRRMGSEISQVGRLLTITGAAMSAPFAAAAAAWVAANAKTSAVAIEWTKASERVKADYLKVGEVAATQMLPSIKAAADLTDKLSAFIVKNPWIVNAAVGVGGTLTAVGVGLVTLGTIIRSVADVGLLVAQLGKLGALGGGAAAAGEAAGAVGTGAAAGAAGTVGLLAGGALGVGGAGLAVGGGMAAGYGLTALLGVDAAKNGSGLAQGFQNATDAMRLFVNKVTGLNFQVPDARLNAAGGVGAVPYGPAAYLNSGDSAFFNAADRSRRQTEGGPGPSDMSVALKTAQPVYDAYVKANTTLDTQNTTSVGSENRSYMLAQLTAETDHNALRSRMTSDFNKQEAQVEATYNSQRLTAIRNFNQQAKLSDEAYQDAQSKALDSHNLEMTRLAENFAISQKTALDTHNQSLRDLAAAGNALGFVKEQQNYARSKADAEAKYQLEVERKNTDFAKAQADAQAFYDEQRKNALAAFQQAQDDAAKAYQDQKMQRDSQHQQQMDDEATNYFEAKTQRDSQHIDLLAQLATQYTAQKTQLTNAFTDQLNAIDPILTGMTKSVQTKMQDASDEFAKYLVGVVSQIGGGPGYCGPGFHWDTTSKSCVADSDTRSQGRRAAGGYATYGMHMLGEGIGSMAGPEFVLNALTTRGLERATGGPLSQAAVMNAITRGGGHTVNLGGITVGQGGGLQEVLAAVDAKIIEAWTQFGDAVAA